MAEQFTDYGFLLIADVNIRVSAPPGGTKDDNKKTFLLILSTKPFFFVKYLQKVREQ